MTRRRKFLLNTSSSVIHYILVLICGLILPRFYLLYFGSDINGLISSISQFLSIFSIGELGVGAVITAMLYKPLAKRDLLQVSRIVISAERFFRTVAKVLVVYVILLVVIYPFSLINSFPYFYTVVLIAAISIRSFSQFFFGKANEVLLNADQRSYIPLMVHSVALVLNTVICIILISAGASIHIVTLISSFVFLVRPVCLHVYVKKNYLLQKRIEEEPIPQKWNGIAQHVSYIVLTNTDVIVLTIFSTLQNVSVYSVYYLITNGVHQLISATTTGINAVMGNMLAKGEDKLLMRSFNMYEWLMHTLTTVLFTATAVLIIPFVSIYTNGITDADYIVPLFAVVITLASATHCIRQPYAAMVKTAGHFKQTQLSCILEALINVVLSIILVWNFGLVGVAIGTFVALLYRTVYLAWYLSKNILYISLKNFAKHILIDCVSAVLMVGATSWISMTDVSYVSWIIMAVKVTVICTAISVLVNYIFYRKIMTGSVKSLLKRAKKRA